MRVGMSAFGSRGLSHSETQMGYELLTFILAPPAPTSLRLRGSVK